MVEAFNWSKFFGCLHPSEKLVLAFIDVTRAAAFYVLADLIDATASLVGINGLRYEVFKQTYIVDEYTITNGETIRFYELDRPIFEGLRLYLESGEPEECRTRGIWNEIP